jgi:hypothetical protein
VSQFLAIASPDEAERMLDLDDPAAFQDDNKFGVKLMGKHLVMDEGKYQFRWTELLSMMPLSISR